MRIFVDSSTLIALAKISELNILKDILIIKQLTAKNIINLKGKVKVLTFLMDLITSRQLP